MKNVHHERNIMDISVAKARQSLSLLLTKARTHPIVISRHGKPAGVLISPEEWEQLSRIRAYLNMMRLAQTLSESSAAMELHQASRDELEARG
jgi:prevent-host-death family protein